MIPEGYMSGDQLRACVHADIQETAEILRARLARKNAYKKYKASQFTHA